MAIIIPFPNDDKQWRLIENSIRSALLPHAPPDDVIDHMLNETKKVYLKVSSKPLTLSVPADAIDVVRNLTAYFHEAVNMLTVEIMVREIKLFYRDKEEKL